MKASVDGFNNRFGVLITTVVGTMWTAYLFILLASVSLPGALATHNTIVIVGWVAQTFLQLVLLPVIIVGQNVQSKGADKRAEQTYNDAEAILHESLEIHKHLEAQDDHLEAQAKKIENIEAMLRFLEEAAKPKPRTARKATTAD